MSRRASLFSKEHPEKTKPRVRFPDELVFLDSIKENDVKVMHNMLRRVSVQIDINAIGESGMAPIHQAVVEDNLAAVELLVQTEAEINKQDADSWTPLHAACANGHADVVKFLLDHGADRNILTDDGERPYDLIEPDDMDTIRVMLGHFSMSAPDDSDDDNTDDDGDSHGAGSVGDDDAIEGPDEEDGEGCVDDTHEKKDSNIGGKYTKDSSKVSDGDDDKT